MSKKEILRLRIGLLRCSKMMALIVQKIINTRASNTNINRITMIRKLNNNNNSLFSKLEGWLMPMNMKEKSRFSNSNMKSRNSKRRTLIRHKITYKNTYISKMFIINSSNHTKEVNRINFNSNNNNNNSNHSVTTINHRMCLLINTLLNK